MRVKQVVIFIFLFIAATAYGQMPLLSEETQKEDSATVNKLITISNEYLGKAAFDSMSMIALQANEIAEKIEFKQGQAIALKNAGIGNYYRGNYREALDYWTQSLGIYEGLNDSLGIANMLNNIGALYVNQGENPKALEYSLKSLKISEALNHKLRIFSALNTIASVYYSKKATWDTAQSYLERAIGISEEIGNNRATGVFSENLGEINFEKGNDAKALEYYQKSIDIGDKELSPFAYNGIGKLYLRKGRIDEALKYHNKALEIAEELDLKEHIIGSLKGLANVYLRQNNFQAAMNAYKKAEGLAITMKLNPELKDIYEEMAAAYGKNNDFRNAYVYQSKLDKIKDSLFNESTERRLGLLQIEFEVEKKQSQINLLTKDKDLQEVKIKRQRLAKNAFMIGLVLAFIIALLIYRGYRNKVKTHKIVDKQKNQIEELLLNILPSQVANELQTTGHATPRHYESVSVMFTDFKGFTIIADKMSPNELVKELDDCFIAFDTIIEKYQLEKIKTIGDSYMCAGGIPTPDENHVLKIVKAGLEIQDFVNKYNQQREEKGLEPWNARIGIHVGPLVAGVVGKKKYAYDIWGSTVNIASRMESNGEPGKVNISSATYELIKDYYECSYRGKISAKNVGEIDMYFIEHEHTIPKTLLLNENQEISQ